MPPLDLTRLHDDAVMPRLRELDEDQRKVYARYAGRALLDGRHDPASTSLAVHIQPDGAPTDACALYWAPPIKTAGYNDPKEIAELGALAVAFALTNAREPAHYLLEQSPSTGTGFDFLLSIEEKQPAFDPINPFRHGIKLEISGIAADTKQRRPAARFTEKQQRLLKSHTEALGQGYAHFGMNGLVVIISFAEPAAWYVSFPLPDAI